MTTTKTRRQLGNRHFRISFIRRANGHVHRTRTSHYNSSHCPHALIHLCAGSQVQSSLPPSQHDIIYALHVSTRNRKLICYAKTAAARLRPRRRRQRRKRRGISWHTHTIHSPTHTQKHTKHACPAVYMWAMRSCHISHCVRHTNMRMCMGHKVYATMRRHAFICHTERKCLCVCVSSEM